MLEINQVEIERDGKQLSYQVQLPKGQCLTIQGLSGIGKSTLLEAIAGFLDWNFGDILWQSQSLKTLKPEQRPVSMMFQDHNLFEHLTVKENILLGIKENIEFVDPAIELFSLVNQTTKKPAQLSGGQRQRCALIRTLLRPEPIVLLDEPFSEQDPKTRGTVIEWTQNTVKKLDKTMILVTHQNEDVKHLSDQQLILG